MSDYPEHERLALVADKSQVVGEFLEWLTTEKGVILAKYKGDQLTHAWLTTQQLLAEFFDISPRKIDDEKRAMLARLREENA